jgi:hypothetical protein
MLPYDAGICKKRKQPGLQKPIVLSEGVDLKTGTVVL